MASCEECWKASPNSISFTTTQGILFIHVYDFRWFCRVLFKYLSIISVRIFLTLELGKHGFVDKAFSLFTRRAPVTEKVMEYLVFKAQYDKATSKEVIPDFQERIVPELALEL